MGMVHSVKNQTSVAVCHPEISPESICQWQFQFANGNSNLLRQGCADFLCFRQLFLCGPKACKQRIMPKHPRKLLGQQSGRLKTRKTTFSDAVQSWLGTVLKTKCEARTSWTFLEMLSLHTKTVQGFLQLV